MKRAKPKASTRDILPQGQPKVPQKWKEQYEKLLWLRDNLLERQQGLAADATVQGLISNSTHIADAGTDAYDRDWALGMLSSEQNALYQIEQALDRIRHGTYGICELTGKTIDPRRLEAVPWARFSVEAERQLEKEGARKRAGLGPRSSVVQEFESASNTAAQAGDES